MDAMRLTRVTQFLTVLTVLSPWTPLHAQPPLAERVQHLEDIESIRLVLMNYGRFLDARDFQSYSRLFAKDGEWSGGLGTVKGPAEIQAFMEKNIGSPNRAKNYHLLSNFVIDVQRDKATA